MRKSTIVFLALAVITGVFVIGGEEGFTAWILRALLFFFVAMAVVSLVARRRVDQPPS